MEKNKNKHEEKGVRKENENQRTSASQGRNTSYQDIVPGAKKTTEQDSKGSSSSNKDRNSEGSR